MRAPCSICRGPPTTFSFCFSEDSSGVLQGGAHSKPEFVVHPHTNQILAKRNAYRYSQTAVSGANPITQIQVQIFNFCAPVLCNACFKTATRCPAEVV